MCPQLSFTLFPYTTLFRSSSSPTIFWICALIDRALASSPVVVVRPLEKKNLRGRRPRGVWTYFSLRSEEHTSELQSLTNLVCRLLLEKKQDILIAAIPLSL